MTDLISCIPSDRMALIITSFGTLIYFDFESEELRHGAWETVPRNVGLLRVSGGAIILFLDRHYPNDTPASSYSIGSSESSSMIGVLLEDSITDEGNLRLSLNNKLLRAGDDGAISLSDDEPDNRTAYLVLSNQAAILFAAFSVQVWLSESGNLLRSPSIIRSDRRLLLDFGPIQVPLDGCIGPVIYAVNLDTMLDATIFSSSGSKFLIRRYLPLIYYCVFGGDDYYSCLNISLRSLFEFGNFEGRVVVICDRDLATAADFLPREHLEKISLQRMSDRNRLFARYDIENRGFENHAPIMYLDSDIVITQDIYPILAATRVVSGIHVASERVMANVDRNWFGGWLFSTFVPPNARPFPSISSGSFSFATVADALAAFKTVCSHEGLIERKRLEIYGDQPVFNYILSRSGQAKTALWSNKVAFAAGVDPNVVADYPFVHICIGVGRTKAHIMNHAISLLRNKQESSVIGA